MIRFILQCNWCGEKLDAENLFSELPPPADEYPEGWEQVSAADEDDLNVDLCPECVRARQRALEVVKADRGRLKAMRTVTEHMASHSIFKDSSEEEESP